MENQISEFHFIGFLVQDAKISRKAVEKKGEISIDIKAYGTIDQSNDAYQLNLELSLNEPESNRFNIFINAVAVFKFNQSIDQEKLPNYFYLNAPAIAFPYIRAYISALTALSAFQ